MLAEGYGPARQRPKCTHEGWVINTNLKGHCFGDLGDLLSPLDSSQERLQT